MADDTLKAPPGSSARPIASRNSPSRRSESGFSQQSPARRSTTTARLATPVYGASPGSHSSAAQRAQNIPTQQDQTPLAGASGTSLTGPGPSSLSQALQGALGQPPPNLGTPSKRTQDSSRLASPERRSRVGYGSYTPNSYAGQLGRSPRGSEDIEVLKRHLAGPAGSEPSSYKQQGNLAAQREASPAAKPDAEFSSLQLQGGDTTRHIYRYAEKREREQAEAEGRSRRLRRSMSVTLRDGDYNGKDDDIKSIVVPGGFRRDHIRRTAGSPAPSSIQQGRNYGTTAATSQNHAYTEPQAPKPQFVTSNFIEFLTLYGHFAGESLEEDDEVLGPDEYFSSDTYDDGTTEAEDNRSDDGWGEDSALLPPAKRKRRRKSREAGKGTPFGAAMLLLKSFVGTGVLFLPRAFLNGGMVFSNLVLLIIAILSYYCFILLVNTRLAVKASFGDMGGLIYGKTFRNLINFSLVVSQIGFSSAYIVFVSENLQAFILAVSKCETEIDIKWVILMQMIIFLPLSLYRNINHIQKLALVADLFILLGLLYLYYYNIKTIVERPGFGPNIINFNTSSWTLFIGTAIFTFEGVGLVIPIQSGMREPQKFPRVLGTVMVIISVVFISMGALSYAAYGSETRTVILLNMPQDSAMVNGVQFLYSLAILFSTPLQIYPAIEITSQQLFSKTGKYNPWIKWQKNVFRFFMVVLCAGLAWAGAGDLDKFVSLVGSFACIPLVYIYPPLMHFRVIAKRPWQRVSDIVLVVFGFCIMTYTTALTIQSWAHGSQAKQPGYCDEL